MVQKKWYELRKVSFEGHQRRSGKWKYYMFGLFEVHVAVWKRIQVSIVVAGRPENRNLMWKNHSTKSGDTKKISCKKVLYKKQITKAD